MPLWAGARIALRALTANPLRSILTGLGVIIGVAAVVTTISIGAGARESTRQQIAALGTNLLTVIPGRGRSAGGIFTIGIGGTQSLTAEDGEAIADSIPGVEAVAGEFNRQAQVVAGSQNTMTNISGVTSNFPEVRDWEPAEGAFFTEEDLRSRARVAVIGRTVKETLFGDEDAIGQEIRINRTTFQVMGVMARKGSTGFNDRDDVIFVPLTSAQKRLFGVKFVRALYVKVRSPDQMDTVLHLVEDLLLGRHRIANGRDPDFLIRNQADIVEAFQGVNRTITVLLAVIAGVSLIVGGIGIMNIMLVSVTERTREIGIRKAVGATRRDILVQFLVEAVSLSVTGGLLGVAVGIGVTRAVTALAGWATLITPSAVALAFGFAAAVGILFGLYPAQRAGRLDPIEALRSE
ncbi:MAG TPA: ABC transporter permease [bacterium]|nr:ABC transporter permease [bacterium]